MDSLGMDMVPAGHVGVDGELGDVGELVEVQGRARGRRRRPRRAQRRHPVGEGPGRARGRRAKAASEGRRGGAGEASEHLACFRRRRGVRFCADLSLWP